MSQMSARSRVFAACLLCLSVIGCAAASDASLSCARDRVVLEDGLEARDITCGSGTVVESGMTLTVHYETRLEDGTAVSAPRGEGHLTFRLGAGQVVAGWDQGLPGMAVGGTRELVVPPELAYGDAGLFPDVPPGATVEYEVELLDAEDPDPS